MENNVVLIQNNFDERIPAVYGPYEYNAAKEVLKILAREGRKCVFIRINKEESA